MTLVLAMFSPIRIIALVRDFVETDKTYIRVQQYRYCLRTYLV